MDSKLHSEFRFLSSPTILHSELAKMACGRNQKASMILAGSKARANELLADAFMTRTLVQINDDGVEKHIGVKKHSFK